VVCGGGGVWGGGGGGGGGVWWGGVGGGGGGGEKDKEANPIAGEEVFEGTRNAVLSTRCLGSLLGGTPQSIGKAFGIGFRVDNRGVP